MTTRSAVSDQRRSEDEEGARLSAYAAGELTPEERTEVERLLAASPEARATLARLRVLEAAVLTLAPPRLPDPVRTRVGALASAAAARAAARGRRARIGLVAGLGAGLLAACWLLLLGPR